MVDEGGWSVLTSTNYSTWAIKMEANMEAQGIWDAIEPANYSNPTKANLEYSELVKSERDLQRNAAAAEALNLGGGSGGASRVFDLEQR
uniref:DUF4219 domain-containing protein n=1 Tax=Oryza brachyantha TaxID=4533 RepID=J3MSB8_ORYBR